MTAPVVDDVEPRVETPAVQATWIESTPVTASAKDRLLVPDGCRADTLGSMLSVVCDDDRFVEVKARETDLDTLTRSTLDLFSDAGAKVVTLGSPTCTVGDVELPCEFIEASTHEGLVGRALTAVGDGFSVRCVSMGAGGDVLTGGVCRQLLDLT
ncbi:MAG: hypothetical protein GY898_17600 [Proteobacteria bacterium]|nr:hypothetical protein [Pseudomonadota bacterium]